MHEIGIKLRGEVVLASSPSFCALLSQAAEMHEIGATSFVGHRQ